MLSALPKSAHPGAKKALAEIWNAEDKDHARAAVRAGARFECGKLVERDPVLEATQAADDTLVQSPAASNQPVNNAA